MFRAVTFDDEKKANWEQTMKKNGKKKYRKTFRSIGIESSELQIKKFKKDFKNEVMLLYFGLWRLFIYLLFILFIG